MGSGDDPGIRDEHTAAGVAGEGLDGLTGPTQDLEGSLPWELSGGGIATYTGKGEKVLISMILRVDYLLRGN